MSVSFLFLEIQFDKNLVINSSLIATKYQNLFSVMWKCVEGTLRAFAAIGAEGGAADKGTCFSG